MIKNPGLATLDHSSFMYCKTTWFSLTYTLIWCSCQLGWGGARGFPDMASAFTV